MMKQMLRGVFTVLFVLAFSHLTLAQTSPSVPSKPTPPKKSNKGGQVRGLTRADAVAGSHGDKGRDIAEMHAPAVAGGTGTTGSPDRVEPSQRPERPERFDRPERHGR